MTCDHTFFSEETSLLWAEIATIRILQKKVFLEISKNSQENTCARVSFVIMLQALDSGAGVFL